MLVRNAIFSLAIDRLCFLLGGQLSSRTRRCPLEPTNDKVRGVSLDHLTYYFSQKAWNAFFAVVRVSVAESKVFAVPCLLLFASTKRIKAVNVRFVVLKCFTYRCMKQTGCLLSCSHIVVKDKSTSIRLICI